MGGGWHGGAVKPSKLQAEIRDRLNLSGKSLPRFLAASIGTTPQNVSNALRKMVAAGEVVAEESDYGRKRWGRRQVWYRLADKGGAE